MNLFEQQAANRRKSRWLVLVFLLFFAWLGLGGDYLLWQYTLDAPRGEYRHVFPWAGVVLALIATGLVANIRRTGAKKVLWSTGARPLEAGGTDEERRLENVVEEMAIAAGVPRPSLYLIDDPDPNAFVTGTDPLKPHLAVTTGLLTLLDRDELQGVIAHEMGHVKNLDMELMTLVAGLAGAIALIADGLGRVFRHGPRLVGGGGWRRGRQKERQGWQPAPHHPARGLAGELAPGPLDQPDARHGDQPEA
ncbi:MAG: M48 family metalloprotease [Gemmatimonadetes bacterium]|nr:M48 family metalloprotease [Gemmatimonadota bacterium]